ncbi:uncharacterized protein LOC115890318 [Sitophilus oryzae]|uniref:Uncharacterized protein LOC115890318 n=1 Tax=Sitophilus oryzae TaxID=7048 RepID=A0A6J2YU48_SITOR|nr:uncharacterized protein LOC115890318 [Sitophilus oryzae]
MYFIILLMCCSDINGALISSSTEVIQDTSSDDSIFSKLLTKNRITEDEASVYTDKVPDYGSILSNYGSHYMGNPQYLKDFRNARHGNYKNSPIITPKHVGDDLHHYSNVFYDDGSYKPHLVIQKY